MNTGVFTTIKVKNGIPLFWEKHKQRLISHAYKVKLDAFVITTHDVKNYLTVNNLSNCTLRIIVSTFGEKTTVTFEHRMLPQTGKIYKMTTFPDTRNYLKIYKITDRRVHEHFEKTAKENGSDGALFTFEEKIIESTIGNIFSINKLGEIITPPIHAKGLNGITRQIIMKMTNAQEVDINQNTNGPLVLVNALRVQKISHLNGKKLQDGEKLACMLQKLLEVQEEIYLKQHLPL